MYEEKKKELEDLRKQLQSDLASIEGQTNQLNRKKNIAVEQYVKVTSQIELIEELEAQENKELKE